MKGRYLQVSLGDRAELLLSTGDAVEHTGNDAYWGDGGDGSGKSMLGRILMEIRQELAQAAEREQASAWIP